MTNYQSAASRHFLPQRSTRWIFRLLIAFRLLGSSESPSSLKSSMGVSTTAGAMKCIKGWGYRAVEPCAGMNSHQAWLAKTFWFCAGAL